MGLLDFLRRLFGGSEENPYQHPVRAAVGKPGLGVEDLCRRLAMGRAEMLLVKAEYTEFEIPKRSGGRRTIHAPTPGLKAVQRRILRRLLRRLAAHPSCMGFERKQSIVTHARRHAGAAVVLRMDIQDFFASTSRDRVADYLELIGWGSEARELLLEWCTYRDALPQGAPTSPRLSNLVNHAMDARLSGLATAEGALYTRYADDMTFSFGEDDAAAVHTVMFGAKRIVAEYGYALHEKRKRSIRRRHQRQLVTGLVVNQQPALPRETRRRLRAVRHRLANGGQANLTAGQLAGWDALEGMIERQRGAEEETAQPQQGA
jgi:hypothetical protein